MEITRSTRRFYSHIGSDPEQGRFTHRPANTGVGDGAMP
jgi:hypothetical protein